MAYIGNSPDDFAFIAFVIIIILSVILFCKQVLYLRKMTILPVYTLPIVAFCICFENVVLSLGASVSYNSLTANFAYIFKCLEVPLLLLSLYEITHRLHEARSVNFFFLRFDEGDVFAKKNGDRALLLMRIVACGLLIVNIFAFYQLCLPSTDSVLVGMGGYIYLAENYNSLSLWLALIPPIVLSLFSLILSYSIMSYGVNVTIGITTRKRWRVILPCSLAYIIGQIFGKHWYVVSSNLGQIILLGGVTFLLHLVEEDLRLAGTFADFLHKSNMAFTTVNKNSSGEYSFKGNESNANSITIGRNYLSSSISHDNGEIEMTSKGELAATPGHKQADYTFTPPSSSSSHLLSKRLIATKESKYNMEIEECRSFDTIYSGDLKDDFGGRV